MTTPRRASILFVDDEPDVVSLLVHTFEKDYEVHGALSGAEALPILQSRPVDILVTDQRMPLMTGVQLIERARGFGCDFTAILLTGYTDPPEIIDAINKGRVFRYVTKPWEMLDLVVTVKNAVDQHFLRREKDRLLGELEKRLQALDVLFQVSRDSAALASYEAIIDRVIEACSRILTFDLASALVVAESGEKASLSIHCVSEVTEDALLAAKDAALEAQAHHGGTKVPEGQLLTRVTGKRTQEGRAGAAIRSRVAVPLTSADRVVGNIVLFSYSTDAFRDEDAQLLGVLANQTAAAVRNLSASLGESRRRLERMLESMVDGVIVTDERNEIVIMNPAARSFLRITDLAQANTKQVQEILGFYPFELVRGWEYDGVHVLREEIRIFDRTLHSTVSPVVDASGRLAGVMVVLRDITEQKVLEERKDEFVSIISHELRTPLTSIAGALELVLSSLAGEINDKQRRFLGMAKESTERLNAIVDDLLDLSKFAKGKMRMNFEMVHLADLVKSASDRYLAVAAEKKLTLECRVVQVPGFKVLADPARLTQVLNNLLTNSIKFTPEGGTIRVELSRNPAVPGFVCLSVWNSGDPIPDADLDRIFERFEQARTERNRAVRGTGLGLSICRSIVDAHGGWIWAETTAPSNRGAKFVVVLPEEPNLEALASEKEKPAAPKLSAVVPRSILVVEDEPDIAFVVKALLLSRGHKVHVASGAEEAISLARSHRPDLAVMDVRMPGLDGLSIAEILRHDPETRNIPILVASVLDEQERAYRVGASAYLQKPLDVPKFLATVDGLLKARAGRPGAKVLVVDDDASARAICREILGGLGYQVFEADTVASAMAAVQANRPDLLLVDVVLPDGDGFMLLEQLKGDRAASHLSVMFISARGDTASKVRALKTGGDDYVVKPFDALELGARVETVLRRKEQELGASPTTKLPGSSAIEREVVRRLQDRLAFALCYLDLDNLKAFNDYYGYAKADAVVLQTGDLLTEVVATTGGRGDFVGHVAGDDFVFILDVDHADRVCRKAIETFDRIIPLYYDKEDRSRGYIETEDRFGTRRKFPIMSVSVVAVICTGQFRDHADVARVAAELKKKAKAVQGSVYLRSDRDLVAVGPLAAGKA
jgi:signal transduction histidine kinase/DNA-binding response OmpR family regulator